MRVSEEKGREGGNYVNLKINSYNGRNIAGDTLLNSLKVPDKSLAI